MNAQRDIQRGGKEGGRRDRIGTKGRVYRNSLMIVYASCRYNSTITENGLFTTIQCLPDDGGLIDSHNASVLLAKRGQAYVRRDDQLVGIDNKLRPYHYQTYAGE